MEFFYYAAGTWLFDLGMSLNGCFLSAQIIFCYNKKMDKVHYEYVYMKEVVSEAKQLFKIDHSPNSFLKLRGLEKHLWRGVDAQDYINKFRQKWE